MDLKIRTADRIAYTNDLHGELILKMIQLKERVQALETLKQTRLTEYQKSETRVQRLKKKTQELDLSNQELYQENESQYQKMNKNLNQTIQQKQQQLTDFQTEKQQLLTQEKLQLKQKDEIYQRQKYTLIDIDSKIDSQISQKISFIQQQSNLKEQIIKTQYLLTDQKKKFESIREKSTELTSFQNSIITQKLAHISDETLTPFIINIISQLENEKNDINIILLQKQYSSAWLKKLDADKQFAQTQCEFNDRNVNCQIDLFDKNGQQNGSFKQAVKVDSVFNVQPQAKINVKYVDFQTEKLCDSVQVQLDNKYRTSSRSCTPMRCSEVDFDSLNPSVFSPVQKRQMQREIENEFEKINQKCGNIKKSKDNRQVKIAGRSKEQNEQKAQLLLQKRQIEEKMNKLQQERNGLKKRMDSINLSKTGDFRIRKAEIEEIRRVLQVTFQELTNLQKRHAKVKVMLLE